MKVFRKTVRPIIIDRRVYYGVVDEQAYQVIFRIYSGTYKSSFAELAFNWKDCYDINLYRPGIRAILIKFCLTKGWNCAQPGQVMRMTASATMIDSLRLKEY